MKYKLYYFPPHLKDVPKTNPYSKHFKEALASYFEIVEKDRIHNRFARFAFLRKAWIADVYVLNWLESINKGIIYLPFFISAYLGVIIILLRRRKIIWMFHNIHPHQGENYYSHAIQSLLFRHASLIVTHSKEAEVYLHSQTQSKVRYFCHPINQISYTISSKPQTDIFIWGSILSYKGIPEFLEALKVPNITVRIIGVCHDDNLIKRINNYCNDQIVFENRRADYNEIASWCHASRYVLFPYIGDSISSSGALIDTIAMGGTPIGPSKGAFNDLEEMGVCITYQNYEDLMSLIEKNKSILSSDTKAFLESHTWNRFGHFMNDEIMNL